MINAAYIAHVIGSVQGVGFRYFTAHEAIKLGISGYAKNLNDGRVEVLLVGEKSRCISMLKWLEKGPRTARVDSLNITEQVYSQIDHLEDFKMY